MDITISIGRNVNGANAVTVPAAYENVSRHHATLRWSNGVATLIDQSTNGTYVNGRRITETTVHEGDTVTLGGNGGRGCYQLNLRALFATCRKAGGDAAPDNSRRSDYSTEFEQLKKTYTSYHEELTKVTSKANTSMQLPRVLISLLPITLSLLSFLIFNDMKIRMVAIAIGVALSSLTGVLTLGRNNTMKEKMNEDKLDLQLKYQKDYRCPKCGKEYSLDLHWKKLKADGKCPYGCGAQF